AFIGNSAAYQRITTSGKNDNPENKVSFLSRVTYSWYSRIIALGYRKPLEREDLIELNEADSSYVIYPSFEKKLEERNSVTRQKGFQFQKAIIAESIMEHLQIFSDLCGSDESCGRSLGLHQPPDFKADDNFLRAAVRRSQDWLYVCRFSSHCYNSANFNLTTLSTLQHADCGEM
ncbi:unnamed protein product, partial [Staurois parvus]